MSPAFRQAALFQSTLPVWGGTTPGCTLTLAMSISIHPPRVGRDQWVCVNVPPYTVFQSTLPVWGGTRSVRTTNAVRVISIHPPRVGRDFFTISSSLDKYLISIHPPRVGRDRGNSDQGGRPAYFNPPSPCGEGLLAVLLVVHAEDISIHPPRVGRDLLDFSCFLLGGISIHPPRVGRDTVGPGMGRCGSRFQSTLPVWGGTIVACGYMMISIFQSTLPVWGGTGLLFQLIHGANISIHPPRVGRDSFKSCSSRSTSNFNPPSPCGEGQRSPGEALRSTHFNPPSPCGEGHRARERRFDTVRISIHPPRVGRDGKSSQKFFVNFCARR